MVTTAWLTEAARLALRTPTALEMVDLDPTNLNAILLLESALNVLEMVTAMELELSSTVTKTDFALTADFSMAEQAARTTMDLLPLATSTPTATLLAESALTSVPLMTNVLITALLVVLLSEDVV